MFTVLRKCGYKESFLKWVNSLYTNINGRVINNGWISDIFKISRGIRQGCPLSAQIFIIVAEVLAIKIRNTANITGIPVKSGEIINTIKISQLADDTTLFLKNENDVPAYRWVWLILRA